MENVIAETFIECNVKCPYCDEYQDRFDELHEHFENGEPRAEEVDLELNCINCKTPFVVTKIVYLI